MEKFDIYNAQKQLTGRTGIRGHKLVPGDYRFVVRVVIFNEKGDRVLIQKRVAEKKTWPNYWDFSAAGGVQAGEDLATAARRELFEELGLDHDFSKSPSRLTFAFDEGWDEVFFLKQDLDISQLKLQASEVAAVQWASQEEVRHMADQGDFIPFLFLDSLFAYAKFSGETATVDWG